MEEEEELSHPVNASTVAAASKRHVLILLIDILSSPIIRAGAAFSNGVKSGKIPGKGLADLSSSFSL
jgi:hypothetical protein